MGAANLRPRINFITLGVHDMAGMRGFYERLGFAASAASNESVTFFDANGIVLGLFGYDELAQDSGKLPSAKPAFSGFSLAWNATSEAHADAIMAHALACGASLAKALRKVFWGGYSGYFADPENNLWEVAHNPFFPFDAQGHIKLP
jgi:uncharacterized protein